MFDFWLLKSLMEKKKSIVGRLEETDRDFFIDRSISYIDISTFLEYLE